MNVSTEKLGNNLESFVLTNDKMMKVTLVNYGAAIAGIEVPDRDGKSADVTLGHADLCNYVGGRFYLGATVGRFANRIRYGKFVIDGKEYQVTVNSKGNHLHGGTVGFDKHYWKSRIVNQNDDASVEFTLFSPDGDEGFPGTMQVKVLYSLTKDNQFKMKYTATTDKPTIVNLTNHGYFNLTGSPANTILDHFLAINSNCFTPTDDLSVPTGEIRNVANTPLDFRKSTAVGDRINDSYEQLKLANGYDQNFVLNDFTGNVRQAARLYEPSTGRLLEVLTDQPGVQLYSGNYLDGKVVGKGGIPIRPRSGLCLECQDFPNAPNVKLFPSVVLRPGQAYKRTTIYQFGVD